MPPKSRYTKEQVIMAALELTRENGFDSVSARSVGTALKSSQNVIFSSFENMDELKEAVVAEAGRFYIEYQKTAVQESKDPPYLAAGIAYIGFANVEPELFRLLFMRDRSKERFHNDFNDFDVIAERLQERYGVSIDEARELHLRMWLFVHGIASAVITSYLAFDEERIRSLLSTQMIGMKHIYIDE